VLQNYLPSRTTGAAELLTFKDYWCYRTCLEELAVQQNYLLSRTTGATELSFKDYWCYLTFIQGLLVLLNFHSRTTGAT